MRVPSIGLAVAVAVTALTSTAVAGVALGRPSHRSAESDTVGLAAATTYRTSLRAAPGFVSATYGGGASVVADKSQSLAWETFTLTDVDGGQLLSGDEVYLRTTNGHYLSAQYGGGAALNAVYDHHLAWETFKIMIVDGETGAPAATGTKVSTGAKIALRTTVRPRYVTVPGEAGRSMLANAEKVRAAQTFTLGLGADVALGPTTPGTTPPGTTSPGSTTPPATTPPAAGPTPSSINHTPTSTTTAPSDPSAFVYPAPGQAKGAGVLPAGNDWKAHADWQFLGEQKSSGKLPIVRDLGFSGVVSGQSVWTYGDTLVTQPDGKQQITAYDSVALGDRANWTLVHDKNVNDIGWPTNWVKLTPAEEANGGVSRYAQGGTNVVEYAPGKGLVWFLKNDRGSNGKGILGAGVATVTASASGAVSNRTMDTMWGPDEPWWGDVGVTFDPQDGKVYVYGHGPAGLGGGGVFLARVPGDRALDVSAYEYWDNSTRTWGSQRLTLSGANGTKKVAANQALFQNGEVGQSNAFWSTYYNTWMFVAGANVGYTDIMVSTAPRLEGPWTKPVTVAPTCPSGTSCGGMEYAIAPHPEYDATGKTLLVTWTDFPNAIKATKITWK